MYTVVDLGFSNVGAIRGVRVPKERNAFDESFLCIAKHTEGIKHIFSFILREVNMGSGFSRPKNPNSKCWKQIFKQVSSFLGTRNAH